MNNIYQPNITNILNANVSYVLTTRDGALVFISDAAAKMISYVNPIEVGESFHKSFKDPWGNLIRLALHKTLQTGFQTDDLWFVDSRGFIKRFVFRYQVVDDNMILVIWFEVKDRLNRLLKSFDEKRKRFLLWNGTYITAKELRTLAYYIQGLSYKAISKLENISSAAVSARLQAMAQKTGYDSVPALHTAIFDELYQDNHLPQLFNLS
jgi:DNA-binding CsgD family transcriptional regulator